MHWQALVRLRAALGGDADACDAATLAWLLRDRKLDVEKTVAKARRLLRCRMALALTRPHAQVRSYLEWRAGGFAKLTAADVATEAATGKARLLAQRDLVRVRAQRRCAAASDALASQLGRPTVLVKVALNRVDTRVLVVRNGRAQRRPALQLTLIAGD